MYDFCAGNIQLRSKHVRGSLLALVTALSVALTALLPAAPARAESNEQDTFFFLTETRHDGQHPGGIRVLSRRV